MISKQDILDRASEWRLRPDVVEKDYVLGWLLAAVAGEPATTDAWIFKGGTCLKKCFVETYRFSEDLDFTLRPDAAYDQDGLRAALLGLASRSHEASGITFLPEDLVLRQRQNRAGQPTWEARLGYRGPLDVPTSPKVRFDLTRHEEVVLAPERRAIFHPYPDAMPAGAAVACYPFEELLAEKMRALVERTRPRDLYDVVLILENHAHELQLARVRDVFARKCLAKGLAVPTAAALMALARASAELASEWSNMLAHQLPALPDLPAVLERLPAALRWLEPAPVPAAVLPRVRVASAAVGAGPPPPLAAPRSSHFWGLGQPIELIRFAGANRLMVAFSYHGKARLVEPYSLRRPKTGNLLLYGWEVAAGQIKAFMVREMHDLQVTGRTFHPRYLVEFSA